MPCVIDIATSPPWAIRTLTKRSWLLITIGFSVVGCAAWLLAGRPRGLPLRRATAGLGISPAEAFLRHPAARAMSLDLTGRLGDRAGPGRWRPGPVGPDDDNAFLLELERRIRESRDDR